MTFAAAGDKHKEQTRLTLLPCVIPCKTGNVVCVSFVFTDVNAPSRACRGYECIDVLQVAAAVPVAEVLHFFFKHQR
jgi:hypothetical protein